VYVTSAGLVPRSPAFFISPLVSWQGHTIGRHALDWPTLEWGLLDYGLDGIVAVVLCWRSLAGIKKNGADPREPAPDSGGWCASSGTD